MRLWHYWKNGTLTINLLDLALAESRSMMCKSSFSQVQVGMALHQVKSIQSPLSEKTDQVKSSPSTFPKKINQVHLEKIQVKSGPSPSHFRIFKSSPSQVRFQKKIGLKSKSSPIPDLDLHIIDPGLAFFQSVNSLSYIHDRFLFPQSINMSSVTVYPTARLDSCGPTKRRVDWYPGRGIRT